jgi:AcrR family transcriptional regulator
VPDPDPGAPDWEPLDPYGERILEAARELLAEHGLRRTSLADIARAAGVSEATLYRRFASRDDLLRILVIREARAFIARVDQQISGLEDPEEVLIAAWLTFTRSLRGHDLVQRLLVTDPEHVLPLLTTQGAAALALGRRYVQATAERVRQLGAELRAPPEQIAEVLTRLAQSLVLTRETVLPLDDEQRLEAFARAVLTPMVLARPRVAAARQRSARDAG